MKEPLTFTQIAVAVDSDGNETLYALTTNGDVYEKVGKVVAVPDGTRKYVAWWRPAEIAFEEPLA